MILAERLQYRMGKHAVVKEIYQQHPAGIRQFLLRKWVAERKGRITEELLDFMRACVDEADRLSDIMVERNLEGKAQESAGKIDQAVEVYELNLSDRFEGNHPYDRLRVIYMRRKQYRHALRVCQAFIDMADTLLALGSPRRDLMPKRDRFEGYTRSLQERIGGSGLANDR